MAKYCTPRIHRATDATVLCLRDEPPEADAITDYDEAHFAAYLQLLYGSAEGYSVTRLAREAFDIDAEVEPERAEKVVDSHLRRAKWLTEAGRRHFLTPDSI